MTTWTVPGTILRVVDADTFDVLLDLGWRITYSAKVRLAGVNAPELGTNAGIAARDMVNAALMNGDRKPAEPPYLPIVVTSHSLDKYGRVLGSIAWTDRAGIRHDLATDLVAAGLADRT